MSLLKLSDINAIWDTKGKDLQKPKILLVIDRDNNIYYTMRDNSTIVYLVDKKTTVTYCIVKKYLEVKDNKYYFINNESKLIYINCSKKNEYDNFIIKNLIK